MQVYCNESNQNRFLSASIRKSYAAFFYQWQVAELILQYIYSSLSPVYRISSHAIYFLRFAMFLFLCFGPSLISFWSGYIAVILLVPSPSTCIHSLFIHYRLLYTYTWRETLPCPLIVSNYTYIQLLSLSSLLS